MITGKPLFSGGNPEDQLIHIFKVFGTPTIESWPSVIELPDWSNDFPVYPRQEITAVVPGLDDVAYNLLLVIFILFLFIIS